MKYNTTEGGWVSVKDGDKVKIVTECVRQDGNYKDEDGNAKTENVDKVL